MSNAVSFDPSTHTVCLDRNLDASVFPLSPDHSNPVDGVTVGVATMTENAPHNGEMHPDGDEILYLIAGRVRVMLETSPPEELELGPGHGVIVPKGVWHRVDILEPSRIMYMTPGPNGQHRPLQDPA